MSPTKPRGVCYEHQKYRLGKKPRKKECQQDGCDKTFFDVSPSNNRKVCYDHVVIAITDRKLKRKGKRQVCKWCGSKYTDEGYGADKNLCSNVCLNDPARIGYAEHLEAHRSESLELKSMMPSTLDVHRHGLYSVAAQ